MKNTIDWQIDQSGRRAATRHSQVQCRYQAPLLILAATSLISLGICSAALPAQDNSSDEERPTETQSDPVVVSATRVELPQSKSPSSISVVASEEIEQKQIERVSDALREIPGLSVVQTGTAGQLTSVFTRGLRSEHTQVLLNGIPINQGLQGAFDFANLTVDNIDRIEVVRGPQSTLYGPRALAGVIQLFTKQGESAPGVTLSAEGGSYSTAREAIESDGKIGMFDYSVGASRIDTDNARPNNQYRNTAFISDIGWAPEDRVRFSTLVTYSLSDAGSPNRIDTPRPIDNLLTEKWLIAPRMEMHVGDWWDHRIIASYDHERQVNDPNQDGFVGPTRAIFERTTFDYQNDLHRLSWVTVTSGLFYSVVDAGQKRPFVLFGDTFISDHTEESAAFLQVTTTPFKDLTLVAGGRFDHFNQFGDIWTYRVAGNYTHEPTGSTLHGSVATGFSPPSSQDKIFGNNFSLDPEEGFGWDIGIEQRFWDNRVSIGLTYFHNDLSNLIGITELFETFNLGSARTQGLEAELRANPIKGLTVLATYTYLDAEKTSSADINQPVGARLPRRPRNEVYASASYLWCKALRTTLAAKFVNAREEISFGAPNFDIEDYCFVNFAAEYEVNRHFTVFGRIDNLTNEHYAEVFGFPALGRAVYGGVRVRF